METAAQTPPTSAPPERRRRWQIFFALTGVASVAALAYWLHSRHYEHTDDAYVEADIAVVSSKVRGQALIVRVVDNQIVQTGNVLVELDPADYQVRLNQARAELAAAAAEARRAEADAARYKSLLARDQVSRQVYDKAEADAAVYAAKSDVARRRVEASELDLSYTKINAPQTGRVTRRSVEAGHFVEPGQALMAIVPEQVYVVANFKETQVGRIMPGQKVEIRIDAYPAHRFRGHVDSVQAGTGSRFSLLPPENATGNFVKVVQRVPVKIVFDEPTAEYHLGAGMSAVPTIFVE